MRVQSLVFWLFLSTQWSDSSAQLIEKTQYEHPNKPDDNKNPTRDTLRSSYSGGDMLSNTNNDILYSTCASEDFACLAMAASDRLGLEAISSLHQKLDDDANGNVDLTESDDFLREELKYDSGYERRQKAFHHNLDRNHDTHISVRELWEAWLKSEVHNWTIEQTTEWLTTSVDLPQYVPNFIQNRVTGAQLPRLAANNMHYLSALGIKDPIHKQKISLKAMDVVLFGPPKGDLHNWKDLTLIFLTIAAGFGIWYAVQQNKKFRSHLNRMNRDMDSLQNAERALENLQKELEEAKQVQESVISEKEDLEKKLQTGEIGTLPTSYSDLEVSQLKAEIEMLRTELQIAEGELKDRCWSPPPGLQQWLQLTHEIEHKSYIKKKVLAEKQLQQAREACEKLRKKRSSLVGAFVSTHGKSIDDVDRSIVEARTALHDVTQELQERVYRWKQMEHLCGFNIMNNNGLQFLENALYRNPNNGRSLGFKVGRLSSQDDLDDDTGSIYSMHQGFESTPANHNKEGDSSGSEVSRQDEDSFNAESKIQGPNNVQFSVGGEVPVIPEEPSARFTRLTSPKSISNNNLPTLKPMLRSVSQDVMMGIPEIVRPKPSQSDSSLDHPVKAPKPLSQLPIKEQPSVSIEDDICSTDSSLVEDEIKKKKRKLFTFSKKGKQPKGD